MRLFSSFSGGKESCLALWRAIQGGHRVEYLFTMLNTTGARTRGHGLRRELLEAQAEALGMALLAGRASWKGYEAAFRRAMALLKRRGLEGGVFGDLWLEEHREWVERVCGEVGMKALLPLWGKASEEVLKEFLTEGFSAVIVSLKEGMPQGWLGRPLDASFIEEVRALGIDPCGERGEYHTLVLDGPVFRRRLEILEARPMRHRGMFFLEILDFALRDKDGRLPHNLRP